MTRQQFCQRFGFYPPNGVDCYHFYSIDGILTSEIVLISDPSIEQTEVDWLERLYAL